jgi:tRNA (uracil-5-)-methyltransferase
MHCDYFGQCGSCTLYDQSYDEQIASKRERVAGLLAPFYDGELAVYAEAESHYRSRAEFRIWHTDDRCDYAMGAMDKKGTVTIDACPKVTDPIAAVMPQLRDRINGSEILKHRLFAVEFLAATTGEILVTLIYHRKLDEAWSERARTLEHDLDIRIIGRSRKQKVVLSHDYVTEELTVHGRPYRYRYYEGGFTQPNPAVNTRMLEWATTQSERIGGGDLLELYCGLGNFTLPLARRFDRVLATEVSKNSIRAAQENVALNGIDNITFVRMSSEEMTEALNHVRPFRRLEGVDLDSYAFRAVLVDPPRAGLDPATTELITRMEYILYISCNPETLARDLAVLTRTHRVLDVAIFDQFPHTHHVESGVVLGRIE